MHIMENRCKDIYTLTMKVRKATSAYFECGKAGGCSNYVSSPIKRQFLIYGEKVDIHFSPCKFQVEAEDDSNNKDLSFLCSHVPF